MNQKEKKNRFIKREQNAEKIVEIAALKLGLKTEDLYKSVFEKINSKYTALKDFFDDVSKDQNILDEFSIDKKQSKILGEIIAIRIKPTEIEIRSKLKMTTYDSDGINVIRESLKKAQEAGKDSISISYLGSGTYHLIIKGNDYKEAEKIMEKASDAAISYVEKHAGTAELSREGE